MRDELLESETTSLWEFLKHNTAMKESRKPEKRTKREQERTVLADHGGAAADRPGRERLDGVMVVMMFGPAGGCCCGVTVDGGGGCGCVAPPALLGAPPPVALMLTTLETPTLAASAATVAASSVREGFRSRRIAPTPLLAVVAGLWPVMVVVVGLIVVVLVPFIEQVAAAAARVAERAALQLRVTVRQAAFVRRNATADTDTDAARHEDTGGTGTDDPGVRPSANFHVRDATVAVLAVGRTRTTAGRLLALQFRLDAERFHLVHLADRLAQILRELAAIVLVARIERDQHLAVDLLRQPDAELVVWKKTSEQRDDHAAQGVAVAERVRHRGLLLAEDLRDDEQIVEEEHLALVHAGPFLLVDVRYLVQSAVADEPPVGKRQVRLLADDRCLHLHHLRDVIRAGFELVRLHPLVDAVQHVPIDVVAVVDAAQVLHEIVAPHAPLRLQVGRVQIRVEHDDGEGEHEHGVVRAEPRHDVAVALAVPGGEHLHQPFDLLRLARHAEVALELAQRHVHLHAGQVELAGEAIQHRHVEGVLQVAEILADHLPREPLAGDQEPGDALRRVLEEALPDEIRDAALGLLVEQVQPDAVLPLADRFRHLVRGGRVDDLVVLLHRVLGGARVRAQALAFDAGDRHVRTVRAAATCASGGGCACRRYRRVNRPAGGSRSRFRRHQHVIGRLGRQ
uniref:Uncharacterized protein n=1 Tax=Anopheles farauti TaxID=69004 RepID=A0A182QGI8_9DIPT